MAQRACSRKALALDSGFSRMAILFRLALAVLVAQACAFRAPTARRTSSSALQSAATDAFSTTAADLLKTELAAQDGSVKTVKQALGNRNDGVVVFLRHLG